MGKFVSYIRVSTQQQGKSGLGLEAQRETIAQFIKARDGVLISPEFCEVESGKNNDRPELLKALKRAKITGATLVIAKLDRLSRNVAFLMTLKDSGVDFICCDMPVLNTLTLGVTAVMAQHERELISERTKAALAAAKARGTKLGGLRAGAADISKYQAESNAAIQAKANAYAEDMRDVMDSLDGLTLQAKADYMNVQGIKTSRGKTGSWTSVQVMRLRDRLAA